MLALCGFATIVAVLIAIMSKRLSPLVALIALPALAALALGQASSLPAYMLQGIQAIAPVAVMFMFAILFFGIMNEVGVFQPFIQATLRLCGHDPRKLFVGVVLLTALVHLDGSGASTFLVVIPAMLPLFDQLQIDRRILACLVAMSAGVNNMLPWGGPTIRAAAALDIPVMTLYQPLILIHLGGLLFVMAVAYWLGQREQVRQAGNHAKQEPAVSLPTEQQMVLSKPRWWFNLLLIITTLAAIISGLVPPAIAFIGGALLALVVNYPNLEAQKNMIDTHAKPVFMMVSILFAAGCFTGILRESGMLSAMATQGSALLAPELASSLPLIVAVLAMPLSLLFDPDSFYFGILPVLSGIAVDAGVAPGSVAHAALLGQMTTGFPVSPLTPATFLLVGLVQINLADHQRFTIPFLYVTSLFMTLLAVLLGVIVL